MRLSAAALLCATIFAAPLFAQQEASPRAPHKPAPQPPRTGSITGTAMCGDTHKPARGAMVMVTPVPGAEEKPEEAASRGSEALTRVASDGSFTAQHLAAGEYAVIVMLPGYLSSFDAIVQAAMQDHSPAKIRELLRKAGTLSVSTGATHTEVTLQRGAAISGRVLYADGAPATQITIDLQNVDAPAAKPTSEEPDEAIMANMVRTMFTHQSQSTDDQGRFRIAGLQPGKYRVAAVEASRDPASGMGEMGMAGAMLSGMRPTDLHVFAGDTLHRKDAKVYELRAGDEVPGIDITIPVEAFHRVSGRLASKDGRNVNSARLLLTDTADDTLVFKSAPGRDGTFEFPAVPAGTYTLSATAVQMMDVPAEYPEGMTLRYGKVTNAFADASGSVIVKDSDVPDVRLALTEVPVPAGANSIPGLPVPQD